MHVLYYEGIIMNIIKSEKVKPVDMRNTKIISQPANQAYEEAYVKIFGYKRRYKGDPIDYIKDLGWVFWDETWADYYGPFKSEEAANEALEIYCDTMLDNRYFNDIVGEEKANKRFKQLLEEGKHGNSHDAV